MTGCALDWMAQLLCSPYLITVLGRWVLCRCLPVWVLPGSVVIRRRGGYSGDRGGYDDRRRDPPRYEFALLTSLCSA